MSALKRWLVTALVSLRCSAGVHAHFMVISHSEVGLPSQRMCTRCGHIERVGGPR